MALELGFDWDDANTDHLARHKVTTAEFEEAIRNDPVLFDYDNVDGEERWSGLGSTDALRVLVLAFTIRERRIRAVTAFDASKKRAQEFWEQKGR
jgi:uncharacterized DUF497 family protein